MGPKGRARAAHLAAKGRPMQLRRAGTPPQVVTVLGFDRQYQPGELQGGVQQGDMQVEIGVAEILAAGWPAPPIRPDRLTVDGRTYTLQGTARTVPEGREVIGYSLWVRGG